MINRKNTIQPSSLSVVLSDECERRAKIFAALSDPTRLRMVELLNNGDEMSGREIANHLAISLALFCHHSKILVEAGLIQTRKEGQTKYNSLNREVLQACFTWFQ
ncbi:MAG: metalloregulator ArsR/SmtB family transcription factor [Nostocaceae cyanobacterium]|nr:metalloregulator ArsR/SmtB family transcription factor [Nostocaceae cyanobacterium]